MNVPEVPRAGGVERCGGNAQPTSPHLFWRLNQLAFPFAPIQLLEQTPSELYLAVVRITETPRFFGKAKFLAELLRVEAQVNGPSLPILS